MKVFKIDWSGRARVIQMELRYKYFIPYVKCYSCCQTWGMDTVEYPAFNFEFLNENDFNDDRVLSVGEFAKLSAKIQQAANRSVWICPGGSIGRLGGDAYAAKFEDFVWGRVLQPQISKKARDLLAGEGIHLLTAEIDVKYKNKPITSHLAIQVEPVPLLTEETMRRYTIVHCDTCGDYNQQQCNPKVPEGFMIQKSLFPSGQHLVMLRETFDILASEEFMEAVKKHRLTGLSFKECGQYV